MNAYLAYTKKVAEATPGDRSRVVDTVRATAILMVVFGHWLAASIWLQANDEIALMTSLADHHLEQGLPFVGRSGQLLQHIGRLTTLRHDSNFGH